MSSQGGYKALLASMSVGNISSKVFQPAKNDLTKLLHENNIVGRSENELISGIARLPIIVRKSIIRKMKSKYGFSYPNSKYIPVLNEVEGYDLKEINTMDALNNGKSTHFDVEFPYNSHYTFVSSQFIKFVTDKPVIANPSKVPVGWVVRYWYCAKPGIRLINKIKALSSTSVFDEYRQIDALKYENDSLPDNIYKVYNRLIGNDLGTKAEIYNPGLETIQVQTVKDGYQTGKADQDGLNIYIPLLFAHNRNLNDKINLSSFNKDTISIKGDFERSDLIVRAAAFNIDDPSEQPIPLEVKPLKIHECNLYSLFTALDDVMFALNTAIYYNNLYSHTKSETYTIKTSTLDVKLHEKSESLQLAVMARPKWYSDDFNLWTEFTPVEKFCFPTPIAQFNPNTGVYKLAIKGAEYLKPYSAFDYINLFYDGICMMADGTKEGTGDPHLWSEVDVYSKSLRYLNYKVRKPGMIYFNFNPHVNTKKISCIYNFGKLSDSYLKLKFSNNVGLTPNGDLNEPYELITFSDALNEHLTSGNSLTKVIITS